MSVGMVKALALSLDDRYLALAQEDGTLEVREWPSARPLLALQYGSRLPFLPCSTHPKPLPCL
jgi:hypothetical protein